MSRWTVTDLATLTPRQIVERCAYHMVAHGGDPREVLLRPESFELPRVRKMRWRNVVKQHRAPKHAQHLIADLETIYLSKPPAMWPSEIRRVANLHGVPLE